MTDLLDRPPVAPTHDEVVLPVAETPRPTRSSFALSPASRLTLATLSGAAGLIHLVMVPSHMQLSTGEGVMFAVAGWLQIGLAVLLATRPSRTLLGATIAINLAFIGVWAFSRIWGLPFGSHAWHAESASFADLTAVGFEAALVVAAVVLLCRPSIANSWSESQFVFASVIPVAVVALTTGALMAPSTADHAGGSHGSHAGTGDELVAGDGHAHDHSAMAEDDKGFSALSNGHQHDSSQVELDEATQAQLDREIAGTQVLVERYPTLADAKAAGYREAGPFTPGLGLHLMPPVRNLGLGGDGRIDTPAEIEAPFLIYDGIEPDSPIAGFMYFSYVQGEPEGFAGPNDHWHFHTNVCVVFGADGIEAPLGADREVSQAQCDRFGGTLIQNTGYMVHVWSVPGYENPDGMFAELTPSIACPDGTYFTIPEDEWGLARTTCRV
jgi:hypothetical protein